MCENCTMEWREEWEERILSPRSEPPCEEMETRGVLRLETGGERIMGEVEVLSSPQRLPLSSRVGIFQGELGGSE